MDIREQQTPAARLNELLVDAGIKQIEVDLADRFSEYLSLILRWNARTNLTAVRDADGILRRHLLECITCAIALPAGIRSLLDFGSGAGLPGIPIALCRPEIAVTLAESQGKKAAFLQEAVRVLGLTAKIHSGRAEHLNASFDCVILRAVDKMADAVRAASSLVAPHGWLALMTTTADFARLKLAAGGQFSWNHEVPLPGAEDRILALGQRAE